MFDRTGEHMKAVAVGGGSSTSFDEDLTITSIWKPSIPSRKLGLDLSYNRVHTCCLIGIHHSLHFYCILQKPLAIFAKLDKALELSPFPNSSATQLADLFLNDLDFTFEALRLIF